MSLKTLDPGIRLDDRQGINQRFLKLVEHEGKFQALHRLAALI